MLRELLRRVDECDRAINLSLYALIEALVEAVEPTDVPCAEVGDWADAQAAIRKLHLELAEAKAEIERLRLRFAKWLDTHSQLVTDAEIGRLVRGMPRGSTLIHTGPFCAKKSDWVGHHLPDIYQWADSPAEALRAIQKKVGNDEA